MVTPTDMPRTRSGVSASAAACPISCPLADREQLLRPHGHRVARDHGDWVRRGDGLHVVSLFRVLAYNLLGLFRTSHLRSEAHRALAWQQPRE